MSERERERAMNVGKERKYECVNSVPVLFGYSKKVNVKKYYKSIFFPSQHKRERWRKRRRHDILRLWMKKRKKKYIRIIFVFSLTHSLLPKLHVCTCLHISREAQEKYLFCVEFGLSVCEVVFFLCVVCEYFEPTIHSHTYSVQLAYSIITKINIKHI